MGGIDAHSRGIVIRALTEELNKTNGFLIERKGKKERKTRKKEKKRAGKNYRLNMA